MREQSRYQMNVAVVTKSLYMKAGTEPAVEEGTKVWKKFETTAQEPVKMAMALWGYFMKEGISQEQRACFGEYLKSHIRNAVEALIEEDAPEKIAVLEGMGWFKEQELESFLKTARERGKSQALVYLMNLKDQKYGYREEEFPL